MNVAIKNTKTGEVKEVKVGWSWVLFLFSGFFGLPLFLRKLNILGGIFLVLWVVNIVAPSMMPVEVGFGFIFMLFFIFLGLQIYVGIKGNELTAKNYLENGWEFLEPESDYVKTAKMRWGLQI